MSKRNKREAAPPQNLPPAPRPDRTSLWHILVLSAAAVALYVPTLWYSWVSDDESEVLQDTLIRSFRNVPRLFAHSVWFFAGAKTDNYYRPLKLLAYSVEYHLFGFRPVFWHLANVLANLAVVVVIYLLVVELASPLGGEASAGGSPALRDVGGRSLAFWTALLFAFHAIHVEAVTWISAGNDLFCGVALLVSLWLYHRYRFPLNLPFAEGDTAADGTGVDTGSGTGVPPVTTCTNSSTVHPPESPAPGRRRHLLLYSGSVLLFVAGLFFKETAITFPAVIAGYDYFYLGESWRELARGWRHYLAYFAALTAYLALRVHALSGFAPESKPWHMTRFDLVLSVPVLAVKYLWATLLPIHLNYWHVYHPVLSLGWKPSAAAAICLFLVWAVFWLRRRQPLLSFALGWFWLTLIPVLYIPKVGFNVFTERYLYIPTFGFCILAAWGWLWLRTRLPGRRLRPLAYAALLGLLAFYCSVVFRRLPYWRDGRTLMMRTAQQSPDSPQIVAYVSEAYKDQEQFPEALRYARLAIQDDPSDSYFRDNLGEIYMLEGRYPEALANFYDAVKLQPGFPPFWVNIGAVYNATHQWQKAEEACRRGLANAPESSMLLDQLGIALANNGQGKQAEAVWRHAVQAFPEDLESHVNLATYLYQSGHLDEAVHELVAGLKASPDAPYAFAAHYKLGYIYEQEGRWEAAEREYEETEELKPGFGDLPARLSAVRAHLASPRL
ncbi:MAG TPA: tetratricopeptide repeat protein [Candidatus Acidoferrales bacterium]|nr:tetratricopeptide repeat protein [Candidatus Acidoferrales bacterium]